MGSALQQEAEHLAEGQATPIRRKARQHYRTAEYTFLKLAKMRIATRNYPDDLWNAAQNLLDGQDYRRAASVLNTYLKNELRRRRPQALVSLGKAHLALENIDESITAFTECIEFHSRDAATYEARLECSKAYIEKDDADAAERLLRDNLADDGLTPSSREWRDSLFALGKLQHMSAKYSDAIDTLKEVVDRNPPDSLQAIEGAYLIADAYRQEAKKPLERQKTSNVPSTQAENRRKVTSLLGKALKSYAQVQQTLLEREEQMELNDLEKSMLRNCFFAMGSVQFDLEYYDQAINTYQNASTRYQNEPIVLESFVQLANCYRRQNKPVEARGALERAKVVLKRLPKNVSFESTTNYSREEWVALLDRLSKL